VTRVRLADFCQARSGDKADVANVALFAPTEETYAIICDQLSAARVREHVAALVSGPVTRYDVPNVLGLNFVCERALGGGGPRTLRSDMLGKTLGPNLLRIEVELPDDVLARVPRLRPQAQTVPVDASNRDDTILASHAPHDRSTRQSTTTEFMTMLNR
jgi:hypothetical protein